MVDRSVSVRLQIHVDQYVTALKKAGAETRSFADNADKDLQALGSKYVSLGQKMTLGVTAPMALLARQAIGFASDTREAMNRVDVVFGKSSDSVREWSEDSARNMGLARGEAVSAASTFGNMFQQLGFGSGSAAKMSQSLVELAADLGSFHNADITEVIRDQTAAFRNEYDGLQRFIPAIQQSAVNQRALADTGKAATEELTAQEKALATYELILEGAGAAVGDFRRTQDDAANAMRTASAAYKDAMAELGDNLLPIVAKGALTFADFAESFGKLPEGAQSLIIGFGGIAAAAGPVIFLTGSLIKNLELIQARGPRAVAALKFGGVAVGAAAIVTAFDAINDQLQQMRSGSTSIDEVELALVRMSKTGEVGGEIADRFGDHLGSLADAFERVELGDAGTPGNPVVGWLQTLAGMDLGSAEEKVEALDEALASLAAQDPGAAKTAYEELLRLLAEQGVDAEIVEAHLTNYTDALAQNETQQLLTGGAAKDVVGAIDGQSAASQRAAEALDNYSDALKGIYFEAFGVQEVTGQIGSDLADLAQRVMDAKEAGDQWATSLDASNTSGLANLSTIQGLVKGGLDLAESMAQQGATQGQITTAMSALYGELVNTLAGLGFNRAEAENLLGVLMSFPGQVDIRINVDTQRAEERLARLLRLIQMNAYGLDVLEAEKWQARSSGTEVPNFESVLEGVGALPTITPSFSGGSGKDPADEALQRRREEDARQGRLAEFGGITTDEYKAYLNARLSATQRYSEEWADLMRELNRVNQEVGQGWLDAAETMKAMEDAWWEILSRQHEIGDISTKEYLSQLEDRLTGLQKFSDEWMAVWREIQNIRDEGAQHLLDLIAAVEEQRLYDQAFYALAEQRDLADLRAVSAPSVVVQGGSSKSLSQSQTNYITAPSTGSAMQTANERMRDAAFHMGF